MRKIIGFLRWKLLLVKIRELVEMTTKDFFFNYEDMIIHLQET